MKFSSIAKLLNPVPLTTTLVIATIISHTSITVAQTPSDRRNTVPQTGCLSGYSDNLYQGDRPLTRYEFAAGLNACINQLNQLTPTNRANLATKEDLEALLKRQRELNQQLRELNERVNTSPTTN